MIYFHFKKLLLNLDITWLYFHDGEKKYLIQELQILKTGMAIIKVKESRIRRSSITFILEDVMEMQEPKKVRLTHCIKQLF